MKTIITIVLLSASLIYSQTISDSTQTKQRNQEREKVQTQNQEKSKIQNQIGSKEKAQTDVKQNRKRKDVFIDKDGDGICDSRQSGMSFNKMRKRMSSGQKGPGGAGSGGKGHGGGN
jgi:predicted esterase YcpF (UPF0227 family)